MECDDVLAIVLVVPLLLDLNNLVGAVREDHASFPLGVYAALRSSLNQQCDVVNRTSGGISVVNIAVYNYHLNVGTSVRALNELAGYVSIASHGVPLVRDRYAVISLSAVYLTSNNGSLLNQTMVGAVVASSSYNNIVVLLDTVVPIPVIGLELGLGKDVLVAALVGNINIVRTNSGNLTNCKGLNIQDGVLGGAVGSKQLNLGRLIVLRIGVLRGRIITIRINKRLDGIVGVLTIYVNRSGVSQIILGAVQLNLLSAVHLEILQDASLFSVVLGSVNAVNLGLVVVLVQNGNHLILQVGVVLLHFSEVVQGLVLVISGLVQINGILVQGQLKGLLAGGLGNLGQNSGGLLQVHELLADGLVVIAKQSYVGVSIVTPYNGRSIDCVVDQLCSVLTRARTGKGSVNVLQQAILVCQCVGLSSPASTYQACLVSVVAEGYEQHLSSFLSSYSCIRSKDGRRLTSNDTNGLAVLDVAACPVGTNVGERSLVVVVRRSVRVAGTQNVDHLRHLRTSYSCVGLERAVFKALDDAQLCQSVHDFIGDLDVRLIRERRTSEHGERASERQHQCENLFQIAGEKTYIMKNDNKNLKI